MTDHCRKLIFVDYKDMNNYHLWNSIIKKVMISRNVIFNEDDQFSFSSELTASVDLKNLVVSEKLDEQSSHSTLNSHSHFTNITPMNSENDDDDIEIPKNTKDVEDADENPDTD